MDTADEIYHRRRDTSKSFILKRTEIQKGMTGEHESLAAVKNHSWTSIPDLTLFFIPEPSGCQTLTASGSLWGLAQIQIAGPHAQSC